MGKAASRIPGRARKRNCRRNRLRRWTLPEQSLVPLSVAVVLVAQVAAVNLVLELADSGFQLQDPSVETVVLRQQAALLCQQVEGSAVLGFQDRSISKAASRHGAFPLLGMYPPTLANSSTIFLKESICCRRVEGVLRRDNATVRNALESGDGRTGNCPRSTARRGCGAWVGAQQRQGPWKCGDGRHPQHAQKKVPVHCFPPYHGFQATSFARTQLRTLCPTVGRW